MDIRKREAARLRAHGLVLREIAIAIGVSERTMERWSTNPEFKAYLSELDESANTKITVTVSNLSNTIDIEDLENYKYKDDGSSRIAQFLARRQSGCQPM